MGRRVAASFGLSKGGCEPRASAWGLLLLEPSRRRTVTGLRANSAWIGLVSEFITHKKAGALRPRLTGFVRVDQAATLAGVALLFLMPMATRSSKALGSSMAI